MGFDLRYIDGIPQWGFAHQSSPTNQHMGVSIVMGVPKNGCFIMENPIYKWMMTGGIPMTGWKPPKKSGMIPRVVPNMRRKAQLPTEDVVFIRSPAKIGGKPLDHSLHNWMKPIINHPFVGIPHGFPMTMQLFLEIAEPFGQMPWNFRCSTHHFTSKRVISFADDKA